MPAFRIQFSLRTALVVMILVGGIMVVGFYLHKSYYQTKIIMTNASGKLVHVKVNWIDIDPVSHQDGIVKHEEVELEPGERTSFVYTPTLIDKTMHSNHAIPELQYRAEGCEEYAIPHVRHFEGQVESYSIGPDGYAKELMDERVLPIIDRGKIGQPTH